MCSKKKITDSTIQNLAKLINEADAIIIGAGAGMSAAAGYNYSQDRFMKYFADFNAKFGIEDMYYGGFYPFENECQFWSFWARKIYYNRYFNDDVGINNLYEILFSLVKDKNYFVITTNVDHKFQDAKFDKTRLFYTQGDYGLFQCEIPCKKVTYDNKDMILAMLDSQKGMEIDENLIPICPNCGEKLTVNLRKDALFVQDAGWDLAASRYTKFIEENISKQIVFLDIGIGMNTPSIMKYPFIKMTNENANAFYVSINFDAEFTLKNINALGVDITNNSLFITGDIYDVFNRVHKDLSK